MKAVHLYALIERRPDHPNLGKPFYIGIGSAARPRSHLSAARSVTGHYNARLQEALAAHFAFGIEPEIQIIAICPSREAAQIAERGAIATYGRIGIEPGGILTNIAAGGQGADSEMLLLPEIREKVSGRTKRALHEPATRAKHLAALDRVNAALTPEQRSAAQAKRSPESTQRSTAALRAALENPEIEAKRRANSRAPQLASWTDPDIRERRVDGMRGKKKTMSPEAIAARQANARKPRSAEALAASRAATIRRWDAHRQRQAAERAASHPVLPVEREDHPQG